MHYVRMLACRVGSSRLWPGKYVDGSIEITNNRSFKLNCPLKVSKQGGEDIAHGQFFMRYDNSANVRMKKYVRS